MKTWWQSLQPRERLILGGGGVIALLIVLWQFAWQPLTNGREQLRASIAQKEQLLSDISWAGAIDTDDSL
ncbi:MAG: type II secretion system protein GspM, partial [Gammaproteobacteria bacterium]